VKGRSTLFIVCLFVAACGTSDESSTGIDNSTLSTRTTASSRQSNSQSPSKEARLFHTKGKLVGRGQFQLGVETGQWGVFLEGSTEHPEVRQLAVFDSGKVLCESSGSASSLSSSSGVAVHTCHGEPSALTFGAVPKDFLTFEITVVATTGRRRMINTELADPIADAPVVGFAVSHSSDEKVVSMTGRRTDGSSFP